MTTKLLRLALASVFLVPALLRAAIPPAENLLPADTLAFFVVPDCAAARVSASSSPGWMFWDDQTMRPFHDKFMAKLNNQFVAPLERDLGLKISDFSRLPQGQLTLAVTANGAKNGSENVQPGLLLLLDAKGKSDLLKTNLAALVKTWTDAGRALRTEKVHGLTFTVVPLSSNDFAGILPKKKPVSELGVEPEKPQKSGEIYFTQFETLLVVGNSLKTVEPVAAHLTGGSVPAIADNAMFAADKLSQFRENPQSYGWFNGKDVITLVSQAPESDPADSASPMMPSVAPAKIITALGMSGLKSASFALRQTHDGSTLTIHATAPESERTGLLKILAIPAKDASVPSFVPADAVKFTRARLDGKQTWAELQKIFANLSPSGQASLNAVVNIANSLGQQKNPGFDIRNDLFGNLNDDIISYQKPVTGKSLADLASPPTLYLVAVSNPDAVINAVKTVASLINPQGVGIAPREFQGRKIHTISLKGTQVSAAGAMQPRSLYVSASGGYLALSTDSAILEEYLRNADGQNKPLRENAGLQSTLQHLGGAGGGMFGYENQRETMRATFSAFKSTMAADTALKMFPPTFREWMDFSLLPDYDAVSKYFYLSTFVGNANADGVTFKVYAPRPPQLN